MSLEDFLEKDYIDRKNFLIKGNKNIVLYRHSEFFVKNLKPFLEEHFINFYARRRKFKVQNLLNKFREKLLINKFINSDTV